MNQIVNHELERQKYLADTGKKDIIPNAQFTTDGCDLSIHDRKTKQSEDSGGD